MRGGGLPDPVRKQLEWINTRWSRPHVFSRGFVSLKRIIIDQIDRETWNLPMLLSDSTLSIYLGWNITISLSLFIDFESINQLDYSHFWNSEILSACHVPHSAWQQKQGNIACYQWHKLKQLFLPNIQGCVGSRGAPKQFFRWTPCWQNCSWSAVDTWHRRSGTSRRNMYGSRLVG